MFTYYEYCPSCNHRETKQDKQLPRRTKLGTDGWGQPVRFTSCECGSDLKGFFNLGWYTRQGEEVDDGLLSYLRYRINMYYELFTKQ